MNWEKIGIVVWLSAAFCVAYVYALYPCLMALVARLRGRRTATSLHAMPSATIIVAAHNEEEKVGRRLRELANALRTANVDGEVLLVSDGSTDNTAAVARNVDDHLVRVIELPERVGKAAALSHAVAEVDADVLVLADTRQRWAPDTLDHLLANFADLSVGAVSGELVLESKPGVMAGFGIYWRFEKWLRKQESRIHSTVGVTGAVCAVRRELFPIIPEGTILDDVYWPLCVAMRNKRVVFEERARAYDCLPERSRDEFRRKVRTLSGNFQLMQRLPAVFMPGLCPIWFQFVSHKLLRLVAPWALLALFMLSAMLSGPVFRAALGLQVVGYLLALLSLTTSTADRSRLVSAAGSFVVLNAAAWCSFWVWITGRAGRTWQKVSYEQQPVGVY